MRKSRSLKNNKKGFTLVEILVVVAILGILSIIAIAAISNYISKGKDSYDNAMEDEFLLAGKLFFSENKSKLPESIGDSEIISLGELKALGLLSKDFIASNNGKCDPQLSLVMITKIDNNKYDYKPCLVCENSEKFKNNQEETDDWCEQYKNNLDNEGKDSECSISKDADNNYIVSDDNNNKKTVKDIKTAIKEYGNLGCTDNTVCSEFEYDNKTYYFDDNGEVSLEEPNSCKITPDNNSQTCTLNITNSDKICVLKDKKNTYSPVTNALELYKNSFDAANAVANRTYYNYCMHKEVYNELSKITAKVTTPASFKTNGKRTDSDGYKKGRSNGTKIINSTKSYVYKNKPIPEKYSLVLGSTFEEAMIQGSAGNSLTNSQVKAWNSSLNLSKNQAVKANDKAKNKYSVKYTKVGYYNGKAVDLKIVLQDFAKCTDSKRTCGVFFGDEKKMTINSLGLPWIKVRYEFYESGTNQAISVKGYTTYWDIDAYQGIHFLTNTTGIYANTGSALGIYTINNAPYVYDGPSYNNYSNIDKRGVITETFEGQAMDKVFTFNTKGTIVHSTVPMGLSLSYATSGMSITSVVQNGKEITYRIRYSNPTSSEQKIKITANLQNATYVSGSTKFKDNTTKTPKQNGNELVWEKTTSKHSTGYLTFKLKLTQTQNKLSGITGVSSKVGSTTYNNSGLLNPVISVETKSCKN